MRAAAEMSRSIWWAFAAGGVLALAAATATGLGVVAATVATGAWQLPTGILILVAIRRAPGAVTDAIPFLGAGAGGAVLGLVGVALPSVDQRIALIAIGIWAVVAGAGFLTVARVAQANKVADGGLTTVAWASIGAGAGISTLPAFGLGSATYAPAAALAITGVVTLLAALRLRVLPDAGPGAISHREQRRRERTGGTG